MSVQRGNAAFLPGATASHSHSLTLSSCQLPFLLVDYPFMLLNFLFYRIFIYNECLYAVCKYIYYSCHCNYVSLTCCTIILLYFQ